MFGLDFSRVGKSENVLSTPGKKALVRGGEEWLWIAGSGYGAGYLFWRISEGLLLQAFFFLKKSFMYLLYYCLFFY